MSETIRIRKKAADAMGPRARLRVQRVEMAKDAERGPYRNLLKHLESLERGGIWRAPFGEVENVLGFALPPEARAGAVWWENDKAQPQARAWMGAGWEVTELDADAETVEFTRGLSLPKSPSGRPSPFLRAPLIHADFPFKAEDLRRENMYGDRGLQETQEKAARGKYRPLFEHLENGREWDEWRADFSEIERILGFALPPSARRYSAWWANNDHRHSQARAWLAAGWRADAVNMDAETVTFRRCHAPPKRKLSPDNWSVSRAVLLRPDATFGREEIYDDRI